MRLILAALFALLAALPAQAFDQNRFDSLLNTQRVGHGLPALRYSHQLASAARSHAADVAGRGQVSHVSSNGARLADRARAAGYCFRTLAENIAWGQNSETASLTGWMTSSSHRRNILHRDMTEYGIAQVGSIWVLVVGRPC